MGGDVFEVRQAGLVAGNAVAVIFDGQIMGAVFFATGDGDGLGVGIDGVFDELGDGF